MCGTTVRQTIERADQADMDHVLERLRRIFPGVGVRADDGGVVDQDVDLAEAVDHRLGRGLDRRRACRCRR